MAAGEGTRLRPLTERWPKPVLPIDGRPVIATVLRELAGCNKVFIVTGHLAEQVEALVGDGSAFDLEVQFIRQPGVLGSADTVRRALAAGAEPPFLVLAADTVFTPGDIARFARAFADSGAAGAMSGRRDPPVDPPQRFGLKVENGLVVTPVDRDPSTPLSGAPLWGFGPELVPYLSGLSGPPYELGDAYANAIADGLAVAAVEIGKTRDLTHPVDLMTENFEYLGS